MGAENEYFERGFFKSPRKIVEILLLKNLFRIYSSQYPSAGPPKKRPLRSIFIFLGLCMTQFCGSLALVVPCTLSHCAVCDRSWTERCISAASVWNSLRTAAAASLCARDREPAPATLSMSLVLRQSTPSEGFRWANIITFHYYCWLL